MPPNVALRTYPDLHQIGLIGQVTRSDAATVSEQLKLALNKIAFLP